MDNQIFFDILDKMSDGVYFLDQQRKITYWNKGAERITGYKSSEVIGLCCKDNILTHFNLIGINICQGLCPVTDALTSGKQIEIRLYLHHKAGHRLPVDVKIAPMLDSTGTIIGAVQIFSDNSDKEALLERVEDLEKKAYRDYLTGLANRNYTEICLKERYEELRRYGWPFGLVFCDVDNFKAVNDQFGHDVGDKVLKMVAQALAQNTRSFDLIGRWGGDEFVALILNVDEEKFANVTERFRILVEQSEIMVGSEKINVTISVGATIAKQGESVVDLLKKADQLMYRSKSTGGNRVNFWE